ncbi:hypothetical protein [Poseidonibacter ostreae]|uniref:Uncharacterized protein n=1 Tax=Poseidonibacter ostreae TaxID=2654171 RepID=A0ABQ6VIT1_9BACT|nr:hypothetical protein [Poseidonibacter ostreae]KAB7884886.1 hypothetical protein GA417_10055 [Poseidonibacter ostreae]KAB7888949.1 hypothetical protein GBG18_12000 [Poseidonibacter ostreae]
MKPLGLLDRLIFILLYKIKEKYFEKFLMYILITHIVTIVITSSYDSSTIMIFILSLGLLLTEYFFISNDFKNEFERYERYLELKENKSFMR